MRTNVGQALTASLGVALAGFFVCVTMIYSGRDGLQADFSAHHATTLFEMDMLPLKVIHMMRSSKVDSKMIMRDVLS
jgi:hypothetical protein